MTSESPSSQSATLSHGGTVTGTPEAVAQAVAIDLRMRREERDWIAMLRSQGVKAAHPDDGWVKRDRNCVHLEYPQFNDGLEVGDVLALGWPWKDFRLVKITRIEVESPLFGLVYHYFDEIEPPAPPPRRRWWQRGGRSS